MGLGGLPERSLEGGRDDGVYSFRRWSWESSGTFLGGGRDESLLELSPPRTDEARELCERALELAQQPAQRSTLEKLRQRIAQM